VDNVQKRQHCDSDKAIVKLFSGASCGGCIGGAGGEGISISLRLTLAHAQLTFPQVTQILEQRENEFVVLLTLLRSGRT
jgi:hypothetical protein